MMVFLDLFLFVIVGWVVDLFIEEILLFVSGVVIDLWWWNWLFGWLLVLVWLCIGWLFGGGRSVLLWCRCIWWLVGYWVFWICWKLCFGWLFGWWLLWLVLCDWYKFVNFFVLWFWLFCVICCCWYSVWCLCDGWWLVVFGNVFVLGWVLLWFVVFLVWFFLLGCVLLFDGLFFLIWRSDRYWWGLFWVFWWCYWLLFFGSWFVGIVVWLFWGFDFGCCFWYVL